MNNVQLIISGMVLFIVGLIIAGVVNGIAATTGVAANIGSFAGAGAINDLIPTLFYIGFMVGGMAAMGIGAVRSVRGRR